jgi:hypothetical protein
MSEQLATRIRSVLSDAVAELEGKPQALETQIQASELRSRENQDAELSAYKRAREAEQNAAAAEEEVAQAKAEAKMIVQRAEGQAREIITRADTYGSKLVAEAESGVAELQSRLRRAGIRST